MPESMTLADFIHTVITSTIVCGRCSNEVDYQEWSIETGTAEHGVLRHAKEEKWTIGEVDGEQKPLCGECSKGEKDA